MRVILLSEKMLALILFFSLLVTLYLYYIKTFDYWKNKGVKYVKNPLPLFGNFIEVAILKKSIGYFMEEIYFKFKDPFIGIFVFHNPVLVVKDLTAIKHILIKDADVFPHRNYAYDVKSDPYGSNFFFFMESPESNILRKSITPGFSSGKLKSMIKDMSEELLVNYLIKETDKDNVIETLKMCQKYVVANIAKNFFDFSDKTFDNDFSLFMKWAENNDGAKNIKIGFSKLMYIIAPRLSKFFQLRFTPETTEEIIEEIVTPIIKARSLYDVAPNDFMNIVIKMLRDGKIENRKILGQLILIFIAGYETSTTLMTLVLYNMATHLDIQKKLRDELKQIQETNELSYDTVNNLEFLDMCIKETLRLYPVVPFLDRQSVKEYKIPGTDITLEKGTRVYIPVIGIHHDPNIYPEPKKYDPQRFSKDNLINNDKLDFLPFGEGKRNCIGQRYGMISVKLGITHILLNFEVNTCPDTKIEFQPGHFVLQLKNCKLKYSKLS